MQEKQYLENILRELKSNDIGYCVSENDNTTYVSLSNGYIAIQDFKKVFCLEKS